MVQTCKNWVFTLNNFTDVEQANIVEFGQGQDVAYLVFGREMGESGTPHLQGYVSLTSRRSASWLKHRLCTRVHIERMLGTPAQAASYCKKDGQFHEDGALPGGQGKRTDLDTVWAAIKDGKTREAIADEFSGTYLRYKRSIDEAIRDLATKPRDRTQAPQVIVYWGTTGTGKTRKVWDDHEEEGIYVHSGERWFDGYTGQPIALFDDYDGGHLKLSFLLRLLDRYQMLVPIKGGFVQWSPRIIYITSNKPPEQWYSGAYPEHQAALLRRLTTIQQFGMD